MKAIFLYACVAVLLSAVISLTIYIASPKTLPECERLHFDDNLKLWGTIDAVPNKETAKKIADLIIYEYLIKYDEVFAPEEYYSEIGFNDQSNEWVIYYAPIPPEGLGITGEGMIIYIRRDCGMITELGFFK